jgi:DNA (cytosine-5)-methyltransferase 1
MRVLDLFSGIGGFALGLESVGMHTVAFCESNGYARRVLRRHWPDVWLYEDVRTLTAKRLKADGIRGIDLICGGFPCQDISCAGKGAGIEGSRSGLWSEYARLIREVRPRWVIAENVSALRGRGADKVLGDLEAAGYSAWPLVVGAIHAGAPHRRQRAWIVAHASSQRYDDNSFRRKPKPCISSQAMAHASGTGRQAQRADRVGKVPSASTSPSPHRGWRSESGIRRVADGVPARMDRLRCLGNAVVPQVVAMIGQAILDVESEKVVA